jgi:DNA-binding transcriptional MerR regulator
LQFCFHKRIKMIQNVVNGNDHEEKRRRTMSIDRLIDQYMSITEFEELLDLDSSGDDDDVESRHHYKIQTATTNQAPSLQQNSKVSRKLLSKTKRKVSPEKIKDTKQKNKVTKVKTINRKCPYRNPLDSLIRCLNSIRFRMPSRLR